MKEIRKFVAPEVIYGKGAMSLVGRCCSNYGLSKPLVVTDKGVIKAGWLSDVEKKLKEEKLRYAVYSNTTPNPKDFEVTHGTEIYKEEGCDGIVALGGGSAIDCAKGIAIMVTNEGNILDYEGIDMVASPMVPLICIPTTSGSAADLSQFAIITDTQNKKKIAIISKAIVPDISLCDPTPLSTMPFDLAVASSLDALCHAFEAYVSNASSTITDLFALDAVKLLGQYLEKSCQKLDDINLHEYVMRASMNAGFAFSNAGLGLVHAMAHSLGGVLDAPHGECNAVLLPYIIEYNFESSPERYSDLANAWGSVGKLESPQRLYEEIHSLGKRLSVSLTTGDSEINNEMINKLSEAAFNDACVITNPKSTNINDIRELYGKLFSK